MPPGFMPPPRSYWLSRQGRARGARQCADASGVCARLSLCRARISPRDYISQQDATIAIISFMSCAAEQEKEGRQAA